MAYHVDFLRAGDSNGDAICIRYDSSSDHFMTHVVDGGFINTGDKVIEHINNHYGSKKIGHMVLTHADNDHAGGLIKVFETFDVRNLWMNRPWLHIDQVKDNFHGGYTRQGLIKAIREKNANMVRLEELAIEKKIPIHDAFQGAKIGDHFTVLAPTRERFISLIPDLGRTPTNYASAAADSVAKRFLEAAKAVMETWGIETLRSNVSTTASNESSIVQIGVLEGERILLTGDAGPIALKEAAEYAASVGLMGPLRCMQVPHHGSRHNVTPEILDMWLGGRLNSMGSLRGTAVASVGLKEDDYPRRAVANAFLRRGFPVGSTRTDGTICVHNGPARPGWVPMTTIPFSTEVEGWE